MLVLIQIMIFPIKIVMIKLDIIKYLDITFINFYKIKKSLCLLFNGMRNY